MPQQTKYHYIKYDQKKISLFSWLNKVKSSCSDEFYGSWRRPQIFLIFYALLSRLIISLSRYNKDCLLVILNYYCKFWISSTKLCGAPFNFSSFCEICAQMKSKSSHPWPSACRDQLTPSSLPIVHFVFSAAEWWSFPPTWTQWSLILSSRRFAEIHLQTKKNNSHKN